MSQNQNHTEEHSFDLNEVLAKSKNYLYAVVVILLIIVAFFGYKEFVSEPKNERALAEMFVAEQHFAKDSFRLALNGNLTDKGFIGVIDEYGSTKAANAAQLYAGICLMKLSDFTEAIKYLKAFSSDDEIMSARALCNIGDCYSELNDLPQAAKYYTEAANLKDNDISATYLMKAAAAYGQQKDFKQALNCFNQIKSKYPQTSAGREIDKYIEYVQAQLAN